MSETAWVVVVVWALSVMAALSAWEKVACMSHPAAKECR